MIGLVALQGCMAETTESESTASAEVVAAGPERLKFTRDDRILDGVLTEVELTRRPQSSNTYRAVVRITLNARNGAGSGSSTLVDDDLECTFKYAPASTALQEIACSHDYRIVDGALIELTLAYRAGRPAAGPMPAKLRQAWPAFGGPASEETRDLDALTRVY